MKTEIIYILIIAVLFGSLLLSAGAKYNDGICPNCNGKWTLFDVEKHSNEIFSHYYYQCDTCQKTFDTIIKFN